MEEEMRVHFTDFFSVSPETLEDYGAFNVSLINDLPLFIDPFLLFNSENPEYQQLHEQMIGYLKFLRDKSAEGPIDTGLLKSWFTFSEVKQNWLGYSESNNKGSGLGPKFANALHNNLNKFFSDFGKEKITRGSHLEKLTLIEEKVGRDNISDFATNLIKGYLLEYTQVFAQRHIQEGFRKLLPINKASFNYETEAWETRHFDLPWDGTDFVLLTPKDLLTKDENWISKNGLIRQYDNIVDSVPNDQLRAQMNNYLGSKLSAEPTKEEIKEARASTILEFPQLIEHYIRYKEDHGEEAESYSNQKVYESEQLYVTQARLLIEKLLADTGFYEKVGNTHEEARERVMFLKDIIESKGGHRLFYADGKPMRREKDLQILFRLTWCTTTADISREVNDGRGPVDFKISRGKLDKSLVEFKLASNSNLRKNLAKQVDTYKAASDSENALKVIIFFSEKEQDRVNEILRDLELGNSLDVILIDGRDDNKPSGSKAA